MLSHMTDLQVVVGDIRRDWQRVDNRAECFPEIVLRRTEGIDFTAFGDLPSTMQLLEDAYIGELQAPSNFSDLYIMLYADSNFYVEMLHWWKSDINIHDHDFSAVQFQVKGRSLNVVYDFDEARLDDGLSEGRLSVRRADLLEPGESSVVRAGSVDPHVVVHLNEPTISLLIRTQPKPFFAPQRNYFPPGVAVDWALATPVYRKKIAALRFLYEVDPAAFGDALRRNLENGSPSESLFVLERLQDILFEQNNTHLLVEFASRGRLEEKIVYCIVRWRAYLFLSNEVKVLPELDLDERLGVGMLMTGLDSQGMKVMARDLARAGRDVDSVEACTSAISLMQPSSGERLRNVMRMYGVIEAPTRLESSKAGETMFGAQVGSGG